MKKFLLLFLISTFLLHFIPIAQKEGSMRGLLKENIGSKPVEVIVPVSTNTPLLCSPPIIGNILCGGSVTFNLTATGYVGNDPVSGNIACNPCCFLGSDLNCDGVQDVPFSVENSKWYQYCNSSGVTQVILITLTEPGTGSSCNDQGAVWVGATITGAISCSNSQYHEYSSNAGGTANGWQFSNVTVPNGQCAYIMTDGYAGSVCSGLVLSVSCTALPIQISYFNAQEKGGGAVINWVTASEINNDYFIVERSYDGVHFSYLTKVKGKGNSSLPSYYTVSDNTLAKGTFYYRLKQVDIDGASTYSSIRSVTINNLEPFSVLFNPESSNATLIFNATQNQTSKINLFDNSGRLISSRNVNVTMGYNKLAIDLSSLPMGMYYITMIVGEVLQKGKLVKY